MLRIAISALLLALALTATAVAATRTLSASESSGDLSFTKSRITVGPGKVTLKMANPSSNRLPHAVAIRGRRVDKSGRIVSPGGGKSTVTARLKKGRYTFYCPVGDHESAGMRGRLVVR